MLRTAVASSALLLSICGIAMTGFCMPASAGPAHPSMTLAGACEMPPTPNAFIVTVDMYAKTRTSAPFESLPEAVRFQQKVVTCNNEEKIMLFPVAEIRLYAVDKNGKLVEKEKVTSLLIEYYDKDGNIMTIVRME